MASVCGKERHSDRDVGVVVVVRVVGKILGASVRRVCSLGKVAPNPDDSPDIARSIILRDVSDAVFFCLAYDMFQELTVFNLGRPSAALATLWEIPPIIALSRCRIRSIRVL
jgi:hypothetical protein